MPEFSLILKTPIRSPKRCCHCCRTERCTGPLFAAGSSGPPFFPGRIAQTRPSPGIIQPGTVADFRMKPMRVLIDYQIFALQNIGGISRYFVDLAEKLPRCCMKMETTVLAPLHINEYLSASEVKAVGEKYMIFGESIMYCLLSTVSSAIFFCRRCQLTLSMKHITHDTHCPFVYLAYLLYMT